ncbi:hypothetical protein AAFF_G00116980 [Aldrovandia affinis]|uniref:DUF4371 domain-containing protein n=1 Tax=Aldrovandia affinis TaxID=143900 RepID=A0AAD7T2S1_9TELE|nr:hypothetical protein AAFF_G00116980 [Aldrovandia affinis]
MQPPLRTSHQKVPYRQELTHKEELGRMDAAIKEKMVKLFNIAYFIAKEEASFTMFPKLVALHQTNGLDLGSTYSNDQACHIFIMAIGSCFFEELQQSLKSARFFSIMSDSSVDRSVKDQELIYCTYLQNGKPVNQLIQIVALDHANSQGILKTNPGPRLHQFMEEVGAAVERSFSSMKRIKSDWRSCLSNEMLNCLLQISVHGPPAQHYDSVKAVTKWWSSGCRARRPQYND